MGQAGDWTSRGVLIRRWETGWSSVNRRGSSIREFNALVNLGVMQI